MYNNHEFYSKSPLSDIPFCGGCFGWFPFGYDAAVISGTISQVTSRFSLDEIQVGWFVGCALIGSIIGVLMAGKLSDHWGRKVTMLVAAIFSPCPVSFVHLSIRSTSW